MNGNFAPSIRSHKHSCDSGHVSRRRQKGPSIGSPVFCFPWLERECPPCPSIRTSTQKNNMRTDKHIKGQANIQTYKNTGLVLALLCFAFPGLESALSVNNRALPLRTHTDNAPNRPTMPILYIIQRKTFPDKDCRERVDTAQQGSTIQTGDNRRFFHVAYFTIHSCQFESLALQHSCKSCQSIFAIWEIVGSCLKERALMCEPHNSAALRKVPCQTQLLLSSSC